MYVQFLFHEMIYSLKLLKENLQYFIVMVHHKYDIDKFLYTFFKYCVLFYSYFIRFECILLFSNLNAFNVCAW